MVYPGRRSYEAWPGVDDDRRRAMRSNTRRDTSPEMALRRAVFALGLRYRVDSPIRVDDGRPIRPDLVFAKKRVAVFLDGCFWHCCPTHGSLPTRNRSYWEPKLQRNVRRDRETDRRLEAEGWTVVRIWEHEDPAAAAYRVLQTVRRDETPGHGCGPPFSNRARRTSTQTR